MSAPVQTPRAEGWRVEIDPQGWAQLTLSQVHNRNALTIALRQQLHGIVQSLEANPQVHVLILAADGPVFTAGLDLSEWEATSEPAAAAFVHDPVAALRQYTGPIIAAVQGAAITGGLELVLACDWIVASTEARFADTHARVGLLPGWGGSVRLVERVGLARAKEMALTGRFISAHEAHAWGLVSHLVAPHEVLSCAQSMAQDILKSDPAHVRRYKQLLEVVDGMSKLEAYSHEFREAMAINRLTSRQDILARLKKLIKNPHNKSPNTSLLGLDPKAPLEER